MLFVYRPIRLYAVLLAVLNMSIYSSSAYSEIETSKLGFPITQSWSIGTSPIKFEFTGESQRKLLFLKIYDIAHYIDANATYSTPHNILYKDSNRQITIRYHHNIPAARVRSVLKDGFELNSTPDEWALIEEKVEKFLAKIKRDAKPNDELVIRWLENNRVMFYLNKRLIAQTQHRLFARTLWSIWFGPHSVVKVSELLKTPGTNNNIVDEKAIAAHRQK